MASKNQTFNPEDIESMRKLANHLGKCKENEVDQDFVLKNMRKSINALKQVRKWQYETEHTKKLLRLMVNISLHCQSTKIADEIIKDGLHPTFREIIVDQSKKNKLNYDLIDNVYKTLCNLTNVSLKMAKQNEENKLFKLTIDLLDRLSSDAVNTINNDDSFGLYNILIIFINNNANYKEMKDSLIQNGFVECLSNEFNKLNNLKASKSQIKYIMLTITMPLTYLLNDNELYRFTLSNDIVDLLIMALNECIENSKRNSQIDLLQNTKYYTDISICGSNIRHYALNQIDCVRLIATNDKIRQKLFEKGFMKVIEDILLNGNQTELYWSKKLLRILSFNQNVIEYLKKREDLQKMIENVKESTKGWMHAFK